MAIVLHHSQAKGTDKLVMLGIANHDSDGGAWPSVGTLARYANVDARSVKRSISKLVEMGELQRSIMSGGTHRTADHMRPNLYRILLQCPPGCDRTTQHRVDNSPAGGDAHVTGWRPRHPGGDAGVMGGVTPTSPEPKVNHQGINQGSPKSGASPAAKQVCWACGKPWKGRGLYCTHCSSDGLATPMISCRHCGNCRKRAYPGEQDFICSDHPSA